MKIAILGTRGVPNNHGGFEQFAEYASVYFKNMGHEVYVYNSSCHPYQKSTWKNVNIVHKYDPEDKLGTAGQFIYDLNCILDSRRRNFDVILQLGYTSSSIWGWLLPKKTTIVTNMDGLEWKRSKYSKKVKHFLKYAEKLAVKTSDFLISDSIGIKNYILEEYNRHSEYIPYGVNEFKSSNKEVLLQYDVTSYNYNMLIARLEPENSIEVILDGYVKSNCRKKLLIIGKHDTIFGKYLKDKFFQKNQIVFVGGVYDMMVLNNLRYYSNIYYHGHTVGGTNPSLLEAMASNCLILAHENEFNKAILKGNGYYFKNADNIAFFTSTLDKSQEKEQIKLVSNDQEVKENYKWEIINSHYLEHMTLCNLEKKG